LVKNSALGRYEKKTGDDTLINLLTHAALSIASRFPYPRLCVEQHNSGQMRFYLKWLTRYEMQEGENPPIGIILCAGSSREKIELMELDKEGIAVAEYWTQLPPKKDLERKVGEILEEARERLERRKHLVGSVQRDVEYFYEPKDEDDDD
jgi:hypothetical protein